MFDSILGKIASFIAIPFVFIASLLAPTPIAPEPVPQFPVYEEIELGVALPQVAAVFETSLAAPITAAATTMTLTANSVRGGGSVSGFNCFTVDEGSAQAEFICGTASGTAITGLTRGISPLDGITEDADLKFAHRRGSNVKITDFPLIQRIKSQNNGEGTFANPISYETGVGPVSNSDLADKEYVLSVVSGGTVSFDKEIVAGTAGETISAGNLIYLLNTDAEWYKVDTDTEATVKNRLLGIAQGAGTNGNTVTGGVLISGLDTNQSGLVAGTYYYAGATAGAISTTVSGRVVGQARNTTNLYFSPAGIASSTASLRFSNTYTGTNTFTATTTVGTSTLIIGSTPAYQIGKNRQIITSTGTSTLSVPTGINKLWVEALGAGGTGGGCTAGGSNGSGGGGGGGGGYAQEIVSVAGTSSIQVVVGATPGGTTRFGSVGAAFMTVTGGGTGIETTPGQGGTATGGDINVGGGDGQSGARDSTSFVDAGFGGSGASSMYGGSGGGSAYTGTQVNGLAASGYGAGGGGGGCSNGSATGGEGTQGLIIVRW